MSKQEKGAVEVLPDQAQAASTLFPDGFGIGVGSKGDILIISFYTMYLGKPHFVRRFAFTPERAKDVVEGIQTALKKARMRAEKKKQEKTEKSGGTVKKEE